MEILKITEKEDGSAEINMNITTEENNMLIGFAINIILKEMIQVMEEKYG